MSVRLGRQEISQYLNIKSKGTSSSITLKPLTISPSIVSQVISPENTSEGFSTITVNPVTREIDTNISPENIKSGVSILGVTGVYNGFNPSGTKYITANGTYNIKSFERVNVKVPAPDGYVLPNGNKDITTTGEVNVSNFATASVLEPNLIAENIKSGVSILGVNGTLKGAILQSKTVTPSLLPQVVRPDESYNGLASVTVSGVTSSVDENIKPENIKSGVSILGVSGTLVETGAGTSVFIKNMIEGVLTMITPENMSGVTKLNEYSFYYQNNLTHITLPDSITYISPEAFNNSRFNKIKNATKYKESATYIPSESNPYFSFVMGTMSNETLHPDTKIIVYGGAIADNTSLTIPNSVISISEYAFASRNGLISVTLSSNMKKIEDRTFLNCQNLKTVVVPEGITEIDAYAFARCAQLTNVTLPSSLTSLAPYIFENSALTSITFNGTMLQWSNINKSTGWNVDNTIKTIKCTNGTITL